MKILKKGKLRKNPWEGMTLTCNKCDCRLTLEEGDNVTFVQDQQEGDHYKLNCPSCNGTLTLFFGAFKCDKVEHP